MIASLALFNKLYKQDGSKMELREKTSPLVINTKNPQQLEQGSPSISVHFCIQSKILFHGHSFSALDLLNPELILEVSS